MTTSLSAAQKERLAKLEEWRKSKLEDRTGLNQREGGSSLNQTRRGVGPIPTRNGPHPIGTMAKVSGNIPKGKQAIAASKQKIQTIASRNSIKVGRDLKASKSTDSNKLVFSQKSNSISKQEIVSDKISFKSEKISNVKEIVDIELNEEMVSKENIAPNEDMETIENSIVVKIEQKSPTRVDSVEQKEITEFIEVKREDEAVIKQQDSNSAPFLYPILTVDDALQAALVDQSLSRALFVALKTKDPVDKFEAPDGRLWSLTGEESSKYKFWSSWAKKEEEWMDLINAIDILNEGIDYIILQEDLVKLKEELSLINLRFGETYAGFMNHRSNLEDETENDLELVLENDLPSSQYLNSHDCPDMDEDDEQPLVLLPKREAIVKEEKLGKSTMDLVNMLSEMKLEEPQDVNVKAEIKIESGLGLESCNMSPPRKAKLGNQKLKIGVPVADEGSTVTVLTPIRAKNRLKKELGVEKVITPVRRSLRFHDEQDYISKVKSIDNTENEGGNLVDDKKSKVKELLEDHEFAYVPNENFKFKMPNMM